MIRGSDVQADKDSRLYRIVAAEAHSWASVLIEDNAGQVHLFHIGTQAPTMISKDVATSLLQSRVYRAWRGDTSWTVLDRLPVATNKDQTASERTFAYMPDSFGDDLQSA